MAARVRGGFPILRVSDLERSLPFYIELPGFKSLTPIPQGPAQFVSLSTEGGKLGVGGRRH